MAEHALPDVDLDGDGVADVDDTDPIELIGTDDSAATDPPAGWDPEAHADEYVSDPAVTVTDDGGDDDPEAA